MKLTITETVNNVSTIEQVSTILQIADFDTGIGKIPLSIVEAAGDLIQGTAAGTVARLAAGAAGTVPTSQGPGLPLVMSDPSGGVADIASCNGRLTLETGVAVSTTDQTTKTVVYFTPYSGNRVSLYDGGAWNRRILTEISIKLTDVQTGTITNGATSVTGLSDTTQLIVGMEVTGTGIAGGTTIAAVPSSTSITLSANATDSGAKSLTFKVATGKNLDIFCFDNSSTPKLEMAVWTNDTTRATALTLQDGVYSKTGATTRRYIGTVRTSAAGQCEDSLVKRFLWNYYNRSAKKLRVIEATDAWNYTTATWRSANGSTSNRVEIIVGVSEPVLRLDVSASTSNSSATSRSCGICIDNTNSNDCDIKIGTGSNAFFTTTWGKLTSYPSAGYHFYQWTEYSDASGTTTWYGDAGAADRVQSGMVGEIPC
jgi:hypothetical protein